MRDSLPRSVSTVEELEALPVHSVVVDRHGVAYQSVGPGPVSTASWVVVGQSVSLSTGHFCSVMPCRVVDDGHAVAEEFRLTTVPTAVRVTLERYDVDWWTASLVDCPGTEEIRWREIELWRHLTAEELVENLGLRWNQAVRLVSWDPGGTLVVDVEPVQVLIQGVDGESRARVVGRAVLP